MKSQIIRDTCIVVALLLSAFRLPAQGTAFTYQGRLLENGAPYNGSAEIQATLWDKGVSGDPQGVNNPVTTIVQVTNGLFVLPLNFGTTPFGAGDARWLQIEVRTSIGAFSLLSPRQQLTPTPYAITAGTITGPVPASQLTGAVPGSNLTGTYSGVVTFNNPGNSLAGNGAGLSGVNAVTLNGVPGTGFWSTNGNAGANPTNGAFIGTRDNLPLEFNVWSERVLRLEMTGNSPSVIAGHRRNVVSNGVIGATIAGGGSSDMPNRVGNDFGAVLGGEGNLAAGRAAVAMGFNSTARGPFSLAAGVDTVAGGNSAVAIGNTTRANGNYSVALGNGSTASGEASTALGWDTSATALGATALGVATEASGERSTAGGFVTTASGFCATAFGRGNIASGEYSFAAGFGARATYQGSFVWADSAGGPFTSTAWDQFLIRAAGGVGIGTPNPQGSLHVYSANNPTVVRVQSTGTPGFGRVEFVSNPQGDANEWRPGYIQSTDSGGFTGGLSFVVNGTGAANKFAELEAMRIVNGRVGIGTAAPVSALQVIGTATATTFNPSSDRNLKENFVPVSPSDVLDKVAALPISRWNFKGDAGTPHLGPMAQDFHAAFGTGADERHIATVDADGVALAAIQGLNQKLEAQLEARDAKIQSLEQQMAELKQLIQSLARKH